MSDLAHIADATFTAGARPETTDDSHSPAVHSPLEGINGSTTTSTVDLRDEDVSILIALDGDNGYFTVPVTSTSGSQDVKITLLQDFDSPVLDVLVATVDEAGDVSGWTTKSIAVTDTLTGEIKISLTFDRAVDLDLHVFAPNDEHIFWGNKEGESGGLLVVDSNANCRVNALNSENVTWGDNTAPAGEYRVAVDYAEACVPDPVHYIVTVTIGSVVSTYEGVATADQADDSWEASIYDVVTFTYDGE